MSVEKELQIIGLGLKVIGKLFIYKADLFLKKKHNLYQIFLKEKNKMHLIKKII